MPVSLEEVKKLLSVGSFTFPLLISDLQKQIDTKLNCESKLHIPFFLKMMSVYGLLPINLLSPYDSSIHDPIIMNNLHLISPGLNLKNISAWNDNDISYECFSGVSSFTPYICNISGGDFRGASHPYFLNLVFLDLSKFADQKEFLISLIHELAHQELFLLNMLDRLVNISSNYKPVHSPYQNKERPAIGRLHSAHALYRMIKLEKVLNHEDLNLHLELLDRTCSTFSEGEVTNFTYFLLDTYKKEL